MVVPFAPPPLTHRPPAANSEAVYKCAGLRDLGKQFSCTTSVSVTSFPLSFLRCFSPPNKRQCYTFIQVAGCWPVSVRIAVRRIDGNMKFCTEFERHIKAQLHLSTNSMQTGSRSAHFKDVIVSENG